MPSSLRPLRLARTMRPTWVAPGRPALYRVTDGEVFEIDQEAWEALARVHRGGEVSRAARELVETAMAARILAPPEQGHDELPSLPEEAPPYLRYLNLQITHRCPLRCAHCYHGEALGDGATLPAATVLEAVSDFADLGGLACTLTGGEPTQHPDFWALNQALPELGVRVELFTSGLGIPAARVPELRFHRVRVSLDGLTAGHERLRGRGTFAPTLRFARAVRQAGLDLVVSTQLHAANVEELDGLEELVRIDLGASDWRVGAPFVQGNWRSAAAPLALPEGEVGRLRSRFAYGRRGFVSEAPSACDAEMLTVDADGSVGSCAMLGESFSWSLHRTPLRELWPARVAALARTAVDSLRCRARCREAPLDQAV